MDNSQKQTVLVIDDNPNNMLLICDILEANGYNLLKADTGLSGFHVAEENLPDFILLDIQLPDIDGFNVIEKIRDSNRTRDIPVIAMTSYAMTGDRERLLSAGCNGYIEKPIDTQKVISQIREALAKSKQR